jgi:hypothetical protein
VGVGRTRLSKQLEESRRVFRFDSVPHLRSAIDSMHSDRECDVGSQTHYDMHGAGISYKMFASGDRAEVVLIQVQRS